MQFQTLPILAVNLRPLFITLTVILAIVLIAIIVLSIVGKKLQNKQADSQEAMKAASQVVSILIIDKKRMKLKEAGLPKIVLDQTPKYLRGSKVPIVKAKIGPKIMSLMCEDKIFDLLPIKKEMKVVLSGIYIMDVKDTRNLLPPPKKQGMFKKLKQKAKDYAMEETDSKKGKKKK